MVWGGCGGPTPDATPDVPVLTALEPVERLVRISMALTQRRPSVVDMQRVRDNPDEVQVIVDEYLASDAFLGVMRDLHAELFLLRTDTFNQLPALGGLGGLNLQDIYLSQTEEPLKLIERIIDEDLPYTELVTAQWMLTDGITARMYGVPYDYDSSETWQLSAWADDRPKAGILSSAEMLRRWESDGSNFNRGRANMVASRLLCEDFDTRDILVEGGIDISDEFAVAQAALNVPACVGCHQSLDPLAGYFWGYMQLVHRNAVRDAILGGCQPHDFSDDSAPEFGPNHTPEDFCYPIVQYSAFMEDAWEEYGLRAPSYYGTPARDLTEVGQLIAEDPRFHQCTARNFYSFFAQVTSADVPWQTAAELQDVFVSSGFDAKALARAAVLHPTFGAYQTRETQAGASVIGLKTIRPAEYAMLVEDLTGYRWWAAADPANCATRSISGTECWGDVDLSVSDLYGYRSMQGGIDALNITQPTYTVTPTKLLAMGLLSADAAQSVVSADFAVALSERRLLTLVEASTADEGQIRTQLVALSARIFGQFVGQDDPMIDLYWALWLDSQQVSGPEHAWTITLSAMLQDPQVMFY